MSKPTVTDLDLSLDEQDHVRNALHFLRAKLGSWKSVGRVLRFEQITLVQSANGYRTVTASMAFRMAKAVNVSIDALIGGRFPEPGTCPRCGYQDSRRVVIAARRVVKDGAREDARALDQKNGSSNGGGGHERH